MYTQPLPVILVPQETLSDGGFPEPSETVQSRGIIESREEETAERQRAKPPLFGNVSLLSGDFQVDANVRLG